MATVVGRRFAQPAGGLRPEPVYAVSAIGAHQAHLERCEYCKCSVHFCGCDEAFSFDQVRDHPELILMGQAR